MANKQKQQERADRAAALVAAQRAKERRRRRLSIVGVFVAVVVVIAAGFVINNLRDTSKKVEQNAPAIGSTNGITIGPDSATHRVIIYEDFLCPVCGYLEHASHEKFADLAAAGKLQVEYRPFELLGRLGTYSKRSAAVFAVVLDTAGADVAKKFHDLLYENQPTEDGPFPDDSKLVDLAVQAGADQSAVQAGLDDGSGAAWVDKATNQAEGIGVNSTPTILLDGKVFADGRNISQITTNLISAVS